jgi:hypothetical protein
MNDYYIAVLAIIGFVIVAIASWTWTINRSRSMLDQWAADNGLSILQAEMRFLRTSPYLFRHAKGQTVHYVTVRDVAGHVRHAYVRCGGWFAGLLSNAVNVDWQD